MPTDFEIIISKLQSSIEFLQHQIPDLIADRDYEAAARIMRAVAFNEKKISKLRKFSDPYRYKKSLLKSKIERSQRKLDTLNSEDQMWIALPPNGNIDAMKGYYSDEIKRAQEQLKEIEGRTTGIDSDVILALMSDLEDRRVIKAIFSIPHTQALVILEMNGQDLRIKLKTEKLLENVRGYVESSTSKLLPLKDEGSYENICSISGDRNKLDALSFLSVIFIDVLSVDITERIKVEVQIK